MTQPPQPHPCLVVFSHGKESGPLGSKIRALMQVAERVDAAPCPSTTVPLMPNPWRIQFSEGNLLTWWTAQPASFQILEKHSD